MFTKNKKNNLKHYQKQRKGNISLTGHSSYADYFLILIICFILILIIFFYSFKEIRYTINYEPNVDQDTASLLNDEAVLKNIDEIISSHQNKNSKVIDAEPLE